MTLMRGQVHWKIRSASIKHYRLNSLIWLNQVPRRCHKLCGEDLFLRDRNWTKPNHYRPQTKLRKGYVFIGVCDSVNRWGVHGCGGVCVVAGGMHGCGGVHGCRGACVVVEGMHGCRGGCGCGGHAWLWGACMAVGGGACVAAGGHAWLLGGGMHRTRRDMVNEQAVRILLECILVWFFGSVQLSTAETSRAELCSWPNLHNLYKDDCLLISVNFLLKTKRQWLICSITVNACITSDQFGLQPIVGATCWVY